MPPEFGVYIPTEQVPTFMNSIAGIEGAEIIIQEKPEQRDLVEALKPTLTALEIQVVNLLDEKDPETESKIRNGYCHLLHNIFGYRDEIPLPDDEESSRKIKKLFSGLFLECTKRPPGSFFQNKPEHPQWGQIILKPREIFILIGSHGLDDGEPKSLKEMGDETGLSRSRIREVESTALRKLRHPKNSKQFRNH